MKKGFFRILTLLVLILPIYLTFFANNNQVKSVPVTNLKDQLSNAQLSFFGRVASYTGSIIKIDVGTSNPSRITANLFTGDTLAVANVGVTTHTKYIVRDVGDTATVELSTSIGTTTPNAYVIATRSAIHTVTFTPQAAVSGEKWQFLIKASDRAGELSNDGMPDQDGFDLGSDDGSTTGLGSRLKAADITCPTGVGASGIGTTLFVSAGINVGYTGIYHVITCPLAVGTSNSGIATSMVIGRSLATGSQLINPAPALNHTPGQSNGTADTYTYAIRQLDNAGNVLDITFGKLAVTESVRVTAIVDPTITFIIDNVGTTNTGASRCNTTLSNGAPNTTATAVTFGPLNLGAFNDLAQRLQCTTNSQNGYVIQAFENRPLTMLGAATTIPDTVCEGGAACTTTAQKAWTGYANSGFGYSLEVGTTTGIAANVSVGITTLGHYKPFGVGFANAQSVLSRTDTPAATDSIYICYRTTASTIQQAGTYENQVSFIATATF